MKLLSVNIHRKILSNTCHKLYSTNVLKPPWDVLFFGTDNFSLESLKTLHKEVQIGGQIVRKLEVVTTMKNSYVKKYAEEHKISIQTWPLHTPVETCQRFHVGVVVSFGNLIPKIIIESFPLGMINVHASLLPRWRGAAPIIHALAAGDEQTGVTVMKIRPHKFDIGEIIYQEAIEIDQNIRMPELHDSLAKLGARNLLKVLRKSPGVLEEAKGQNSTEATLAPRVDSTMANINFMEHSAKDLYNLGRALSGLHPLLAYYNGKPVKLHNIVSYSNVTDVIHSQHDCGVVLYNKTSKLLQIKVKDGWINVDKVGIPGKKVMNAIEFRNGYIKQTKSKKVKFTSVPS